jgi:hypothetical protein
MQFNLNLNLDITDLQDLDLQPAKKKKNHENLSFVR